MEEHEEAAQERPDWRLKVSTCFPLGIDEKNLSGLPWGCIVRPFAGAADAVPVVDAASVDRCSNCFGYPNHLCRVEYRRWVCSLCGHRNQLSNRYGRRGERHRVPELSSACYELDMKLSAEDELVFGDTSALVAVVDISGDTDCMELVRSALRAALGAMQPNELLGLVTVGTDVGLYDLRSSPPSVRHIAVPAIGGLPLELEEVLGGVSELLVPIGAHKPQIHVAIDSLLSPAELATAAAADAAAAAAATTQDGAEPTAAAPVMPPSPKRRVGFGTCLSALLDLLQTADPSEFSVRLLSFLAGPPNLGLGALRPGEAASSADDGRKPGSTEFYEHCGRLCAARGICAELFVVAPRDGEVQQPVDLASLKPLATLSGGSLLMYEPSADDAWASLPIDVHRLLSRRRAMQGMLRLRTSPEYRVARAFGHLTPDAEYGNLWHVVAADEQSSFAFDFEFEDGFDSFKSEGEGEGEVVVPCIQLAFCYCARVSGTRLLQKRLRVETRQVTVATAGVKQIYETMEPGVVLKLLMHKIVRACEEEGVAEGAELVKDWLCRLLVAYRRNLELPAPESVATLFPKGSGMSTIPRYVFGLLKSPLLRLQVNIPPRCFYARIVSRQQSCVACTSCCLRRIRHQTGAPTCKLCGAGWSPPSFAGRFILTCSSTRISVSIRKSTCHGRCIENKYDVAATQTRGRLPLSIQTIRDHGGHFAAGAAVTATGEAPCPYFVFDAFSVIVVYTPIHAEHPLPDGALWPPVHGSALREHVAALKDKRLVTPRVVYARPPDPSCQWLADNVLLDDPHDEVQPALSWSDFLKSLSTAGPT
jgi:hypothetical protein